MTREPPACTCITCGDQGIEMIVVELDSVSGLARCTDSTGTVSDVEIGLIDTALPGAHLIVHAGTAIGRLDLEERPA
jgi:hydrogenase maturation factor